MPINRWFIATTMRLARDPRVRAKAAEMFEKEVKPRAAGAWQAAKPKLEATRDEVAKIARETDARNNPGVFAARLKKRFLDRT